jgi:hypothetical protein
MSTPLTEIEDVSDIDRVAGDSSPTTKAIWQVVFHYARATSLAKLAPHDLAVY